MQDATINNYTYMKSSVKLTLKDHKGNKIDLIATTEVEKLTNSDRLNAKGGTSDTDSRSYRTWHHYRTPRFDGI